MATQDFAGDPRFTVFIRLPFPRGDFVDPPPVNWDAGNDRILWDVLSVAPKEGVDLASSAEKFNVTLPFLLQHVAWLYDRRLSQVRAQFRRVGHQNPLSGQATSAGGGTPGGSVPMYRSGSDGSRIQSRLFALQRDISAAKADSSSPQTPNISQAPNFPRPTPIRNHSSGDAVITLPKPYRRSSGEVPQLRGRGEPKTNALPPLSPRGDEDSPEPLSSSSSSSDSDEDSNRPQYRRYGKFSMVQKRAPPKNEEEDDEEDSPAFLPLESIHETGKAASLGDPAATLRETPDHIKHQSRQVSGAATPPAKAKQELPSSTTSSSSGMAAASPANGPSASRRPAAPVGPLSPRRTAELAGRSPHGRGSEGTPSMGSSFSDLDDASVSQSALEEALLSNMRSGVTSRMSTISQALRSRYL
ncbi:Atg29p [Nannizzia gypsea CBS 118893]|uniref:Autophagy-related protein 29 n=1 Tax=Arthroderma gypseum (strain ATCC MYA-4604 / CBS 118893) TaxID=535722 RepID=E4UW06_ARTGP|nr:Atg29p [Nannizzia gypsea CBS 118893]EFR02454.1 Atg29p [Nannizzia gypsea CBS 118893]